MKNFKLTFLHLIIDLSNSLGLICRMYVMFSFVMVNKVLSLIRYDFKKHIWANMIIFVALQDCATKRLIVYIDHLFVISFLINS